MTLPGFVEPILSEKPSRRIPHVWRTLGALVVCGFGLFMCAPIHCKLPNGSKLTPDSTIRDLRRDNFQQGPLKMFCTWRSFRRGLAGECWNGGHPMDVLRRAKVRNKRKHAPEQNTNYGSTAFGKWKERKIQKQRMLLSKKVGDSGLSPGISDSD